MDFEFKTEGNTIFASGTVDGPAARQLISAMTPGALHTLDFSGVTGIRFAGLRALLSCRRSGQRFCVINAEDNVAERFEDTGVSVFINICRKPKPLHIGEYDEFGASFLSHAFNSEDGDSMIKVYGKRVPKWLVAQEKAVARAVMVFGIPTPLVGTLYEDGESTGLDFERIEGKRSFSRIIAEEPGRLEEISRRFAVMCRNLHSTPCDTNIFADRSIYYRQAVMNCRDISDSLRGKLISFIDSIPSETTCLHGDMQLSNVITNGVEDLWIDLSDFGYGNHMFDMGMWHFLSKLNTEERLQALFHLGKEDMARVWDFFVEEYFGAVTPEAKAGVEAEVMRFAALHMIYIGSTYGFEPGMTDFVANVFA